MCVWVGYVVLGDLEVLLARWVCYNRGLGLWVLVGGVGVGGFVFCLVGDWAVLWCWAGWVGLLVWGGWVGWVLWLCGFVCLCLGGVV